MAPQTIMQQPINVLFQHLQTRRRVEIWLYENAHTKLQGVILGFDEFMNLVLGEATEHNMKTNSSKSLNTILLKGDTITMVTTVN